MRPLLTPLVIVLLGIGITACGEAGKSTSSAFKTGSDAAAATGNSEGSHITTTAQGIIYDGDDDPIRFYGHEASAVDTQTLTALVRRYYAAAANQDGATACSLMASLTVEAIPEDYGEEPGLRGKTCAAIMSKLFKQRHQELLRDSAMLEVIGVRVEGSRALLLLSFNKASEPNHFVAHREGTSWKIWELFANHMP